MENYLLKMSKTKGKYTVNVENNSCKQPDNKMTAEKNKDIDGGYGWVIVFASFMTNVIVDGVCFSVGIFMIEFLDHFGGSKAKMSWVGSVLNGMYLCIGPFAGALAHMIGYRQIAIIGALITTISYILAAFSPNVDILIVTYGAMGGFGFGLLYLPAIVMVGFYFDKRRALATGIGVCGSGIGAFIFAPLCHFLLVKYSWKGASWILAGITLQGVVIGALFRPLEKIEDVDKAESMNKSINNNKDHTRESNDVEIKEIALTICMAADKNIEDTNRPNDGVYVLSEFLEKHETSVKTESFEKYHTCISNESICVNAGACTGILEESPDKINTKHDAQKRNHNSRSKTDCNKEVLVVNDLKAVEVKILGSIPEFRLCKGNMPEKFKDPVEYNLTSLSADHDMMKEVCPDNGSIAISKTNPLSCFVLLKDPVFFIYGFSCFLTMYGFYIPFIFLPDHAIQMGLSGEQGAFLISIIGISNTVSRVLCGYMSDLKWVDCLMFNNVALIIGGTATILCPFCFNYALLAVYAIVFGFGIAVFVSLRSIIVVELMGLDHLTHAFGFVTMFQGFSAFIGSPVAGALYDATGSYNISFYMAGSTLVLAGIINLPLHRLRRCLRNQK